MPTLHVLGTCAGWPEPGRACCGYAIRAGDSYLAVDLGHGTLGPLLRLLGGDLTRLAGVVVSHAHPDHCADLIGLARALVLGSSVRHVPLVAPPRVARTAAAADPEDGEQVIAEAFATPESAASAGPFGVTTSPTPHYVENYACRVQADDRVLVHTGDTGPDERLARFASSADVLLSESTDRAQEQHDSADADTRRYQLTGSQAGELAMSAQVGHLVLTHFWPGNDRDLSRREAQKTYRGPVTVADEGAAIEV